MHTLRSGRSGVNKIAAAVAVTVALVAAAATAAPATAVEEPFNVALASGENAPAVEVSYVTGWNSAAALNNGNVAPTNTYTQMWGTWGAPGNPTQDVATYTWERPVTVSSSKLYLWQNHITGDAGVMIPAAWKVEYLTKAGEWMPVTGAGLEYPVPVLDTANPVSSLPPVQATFDAVTTTGVRLVLDRVVFDGQRKATSVIEWEVWGVDAPVVDPEPEDPNAFIDAERVAVRTVTGTAPALPAQVWVIGEDGPLTYVDVEWAAVAASNYAAAGEFEVVGDPAGYDGQTVSATVFVADALSEAIEAVDYTATITTPGVEPILPGTVRATYDDGTASSAVDVEWASIDPAAYAEADAIFDVAGAVAGYEPGALATVFVVEPLTQAEPIVAIELDSAPQGSGWYTTAPTVTVTADETASPVASIEYSLEGETWQAYDQPFTVDAQGEVTISARATSEDGAVGEASESIKVDTVAPQTGIDWIVVDGTSVTVTLTPADAQPGSGVTRTVWSDGPDPSPTGETNNMYATYDEPFSVQLTSEPRYVHVQAQDAAGNVEEHVTVELPTLVADGLDLQPTVGQRCVAGKTYLAVSVRNADDVAADVTVQTAFGSKTLTALAPGTASTATFATRALGVVAGEVTVTGSAGDATYDGAVAYPAFNCGL